MTPQILRTGAKVAEKRGNPICADQMRAAAGEIERLIGLLLANGIDPQSEYIAPGGLRCEPDRDEPNF